MIHVDDQRDDAEDPSLTAAGRLGQAAEEHLYARLDQLWYRDMTGEDRAAAEDRLLAKELARHDARCKVAP